MYWLEVAGWLGAIFTLGAYSLRTMKMLRTVAIAANLSFITYGLLTPVYPMLVLHLVLLPLNIVRLYEILSATRRLRDARSADDPIKALRPFLKTAQYADGDILFRRGEAPDRIYYLDSGAVELPEIGETLESGTLFGEMAYFSNDRARTTTAICRGPCRIMTIDESTFMRVFHQHPEFGYYVIRLMAARLIDGSQKRPEIYREMAVQ